MIKHISIGAKNPARTAQTLAQFWQVPALPFPMYEDSYVVFLGSNTSCCVEIYPLGQLTLNGDNTLPELDRSKPLSAGPFHAALAVEIDEAQIGLICDAAGWRYRTGIAAGVARWRLGRCGPARARRGRRVCRPPRPWLTRRIRYAPARP